MTSVPNPRWSAPRPLGTDAPDDPASDDVTQIDCPSCDGDGFTAEHHPSCAGHIDCASIGLCPAQARCEDCEGFGVITDPSILPDGGEAAVGVEPSPRHAPRVLVIDDCRFVRSAVRRVLNHLGWVVFDVCGPECAASIYPMVDVVLTDWDMGTATGADVIAAAPCLVAVLSGSDDARSYCKSHGVPFIMKGGGLDDIDEILRGLL